MSESGVGGTEEHMTESVQVGQIWASTHSSDRTSGWRQKRHVVRVEPPFVWLQTERRDGGLTAATRTRLRNGTIPAHRLVSRG